MPGHAAKRERRRAAEEEPARCDQCGRTAEGVGHLHWLVLRPLCTGERFAFCGVACLRDHAEEMMGN